MGNESFLLLQVQELSLAQRNMTADDVTSLFQEMFSKALNKVSVGDIFSEEWDRYRKVRKTRRETEVVISGLSLCRKPGISFQPKVSLLFLKFLSMVFSWIWRRRI